MPAIDNAARFVQNKSAAICGAEACGMNIEENIKRGHLAIEEILQTHGEVKGAMERPETGAIDFLWGKEGTEERKYKDGFGIAKILLKHGMEAIHIIPDVIAKGQYEEAANGGTI